MFKQQSCFHLVTVLDHPVSQACETNDNVVLCSQLGKRWGWWLVGEESDGAKSCTLSKCQWYQWFFEGFPKQWGMPGSSSILKRGLPWPSFVSWLYGPFASCGLGRELKRCLTMVLSPINSNYGPEKLWPPSIYHPWPPSIYHPFTIHLPSFKHPFTIHLPSIYHPFTIHLPSFKHPFTIHLPSIYHPFTIHLPSIYHPFTIHLPSIYHPLNIHLPSIYHPFTIL